MAAELIGLMSVEGGREDDGHRTYDVKWKVKSLKADGGLVGAMNVSGLPAIGSTLDLWDSSVVDNYAYCWPTKKVTPYKTNPDGDVPQYYVLTQKFTTKPFPEDRCMDTEIEDPTSEPARVRGVFNPRIREAMFDRFGDPIKNSAHELLRGQVVEFDESTMSVSISQNVLDLELELLAGQINTLNDSTLFGFAARKVKLSRIDWERKLYGSCNFYYTRSFVFDIDGYGFDRTIPDEGTMVLNGHWDDDDWVLDQINGVDPDPADPTHFIRYKDRQGENSRTFLDGAGVPARGFLGTGTESTNVGQITIQKYGESNFLLLGIPSTV